MCRIFESIALIDLWGVRGKGPERGIDFLRVSQPIRRKDSPISYCIPKETQCNCPQGPYPIRVRVRVGALVPHLPA